MKERVIKTIKGALPQTTKTCLWIIKITLGVSFAMMLLKYLDVLPWIADLLDPLFKYVGLPGECALAFVSGYFVNVYSAVAVISTLNLDVRALTILGAMILCSHSMILETAVLKKTGANPVRMVIIRTIGSILIGIALNLIMPASDVVLEHNSVVVENISFGAALYEWFIGALKIVVMLVVIIYSLNILQRLLTEFGVMAKISNLFAPLMRLFALPKDTAFLWLVANIIGLGYGAAAILDALDSKSLSKKDVELIDTHIAVSHSNFEDLLIMTALGGVWWIMLLIRWVLAVILVLLRRLEYRITTTSS